MPPEDLGWSARGREGKPAFCLHLPWSSLTSSWDGSKHTVSQWSASSKAVLPARPGPAVSHWCHDVLLGLRRNHRITKCQLLMEASLPPLHQHWQPGRGTARGACCYTSHVILMGRYSYSHEDETMGNIYRNYSARKQKAFQQQETQGRQMISLSLPKADIFHCQMNCSQDCRNYF